MGCETLTEADLVGRNGTGEWHPHWTQRGWFTDGVRTVAEKGGAYWLIDAVMSYQTTPLVKNEPFQVWTLTVLPTKAAVLEMTDGNAKTPLVWQKIEFTDFPLQTIEFYFEDNVLMLPSER